MSDPIEEQPAPQPGNSESQIIMLVGPESTYTKCAFCKAFVKTDVKLTNNTLTHIAGALWCLKCCLCCCIPYCKDTAKNVDHYCPNCWRYLGTYHR